MTASSIPYRPHNHSDCVQDALAEARRICEEHRARLTPMRQRVLELVWQSHQPLGAYDLLYSLASEGHNAAPPTVYRALEFLQKYGLVHRIASLNAYIGCNRAGESHTGVFLICRQCRRILELTSRNISGAIKSAALEEGFVPEESTLEISGLCPVCKGAGTHE